MLNWLAYPQPQMYPSLKNILAFLDCYLPDDELLATRFLSMDNEPIYLVSSTKKEHKHNMTFMQYFLFIKLTFCLNGQFSSLYLMHTPRNTIRRFLLIVLKQFSPGHGCTGFAIILRRGIIDWAW